MSEPAPMPTDGSWRSLLVWMAVGGFGVVMEWVRRRIDRWEDGKDAEQAHKLRIQRHRDEMLYGIPDEEAEEE